MHRIDGAGATIDNKFTEGNPTTGIQATVVTADWANAVQEEIANVIEGAGVVLNKAQNNQLALAISSMIAAAGGGGGSGTGEANTGSNIGTGSGSVFKQKLGVDLQFRTLKAGAGVTITNGANEVTISASGGGSGEANDGTNLGTGEGIYSSKSGVSLQFKTLKAGTGVTLSSTASEVTINATGGGGGVTDHGALTGLSDDDHPQYYNQARGDARYARLAAANTFTDVQTATGFAVSSDRRLKDEITPLAPMGEQTGIGLYRWRWNELSPRAGEMDSGVLADEVEAVFPSCVFTGEDGYKRVDYGKLAVHLILSER
ncbi:MAG TPA: tail fiber domain-containing protein [Pseudoxanthomonas sp.]